jgi:vacuolar protein sorting-associated protein IST1
MRFGPAFGQLAAENTDNKVAPRVLSKLTVSPPTAHLVNSYLREIARTYNVSWGVDSDSDEEGGMKALEPPLEAEFGDSVERQPIVVAPPSPTSENLRPLVRVPTETVTPRKGSTEKAVQDSSTVPSIDDLMNRFEALKKR